MTNSQQPTPSNSPTEEQKIIIKDYQHSLKFRGFCLLDSSASNQTQLYNYFNGATLPFSFLGNDFSKWLLSNGKKCSFRTPSYLAYTLPHIVGSKFIPDAGKFYIEPQSGIQYANTYQRYKPTSASTEVSPLFLDFLERLAPDPSERHLFVQWVAHIFQHPSERPSWHIMLPSAPGTGKGFLIQSILNPLLLHTSVVNSYSKVMGQFSTVMAETLLVLLDDPKSKSDDTQTKLKSLLSEERAYCERKGLQGGMENTFTRFILASNEARPLHLESTERRWLVLTPLLHRISLQETQEFIKSLSDWLELPGSLDAVYNWMMEYPLDGFNPKHVEQSTALKAMIGMSVNPNLEFIQSFISENTVFRSAELMEAFRAESMSLPTSQDLPHLLREAGYEIGQYAIDGPRIRLAHPIGMTLGTIRDTYKPATL